VCTKLAQLGCEARSPQVRSPRRPNRELLEAPSSPPAELRTGGAMSRKIPTIFAPVAAPGDAPYVITRLANAERS